MKKYSILSIAICVLPFNFSYASFYGGINAGINSVSIKKNLVYPLEVASPTSSSYRSDYTNFHGQLLVGYDFFTHSKIRAAIEGNLDIYTGKSEYSINDWYFTENAHAEEQLERGISLFLLPSYQYNEFIRLFVGPGITKSEFSIKSINTAANIGVSGQFQQWLTGGSLKAGVANKLTETLELLFTYQFTQYSSVTWSNVEPLSGETLRGTYKPNANFFMIGLKANLPQ